MDRTYKTFCETAVDTLKSPLKRLKSFSRQEETFWALRDINFEVYPGEVVGIIGRNGAGKSSLLKILSRITHPTEGEVILRGRVASLLEVGTGFHPELTGRENVYFNGAILGMTKQEIEDKFDEIVEFSGVKDFLDTPLKRYSSGMQVRLAFAVAAHLEPEILVVDEVLAVGDAEFQKKCLGKMKDVSEGGRTVLIVSHNMSMISSLCHRVIVLDSGHLNFDGKVFDGIDKYTVKASCKPLVNLEDMKENRMDRPQEYSKLKRMSVFNEELQPCDTFIMGQEMVIHLEVYCKQPMFNAELGVKLSSKAGVAIHYFVSTWEGLRVDLPQGLHCFEVRIPLRVYPGTYLLGVWALREGNWSDDCIDGVMAITVVGADITRHSANFEKYAFSGCEVYVPSKWRQLR
jgi:lipopolysaccharide transport system ATP-binding protein